MADRRATTSRRRVLRAAPALAAAGLAGCSGGGDGTATATPTPTPELPTIEKRTVQRDRAAIRHIRLRVSGTIEWPVVRWFDTVDPALLGLWTGGDSEFEFRADGAFRLEDSDSRFTGSYRAVEDVLTLALGDGETLQYGYAVEREDGTRTLRLYQDGSLSGEFTLETPAQDDRDVVQRYRDLLARPAADGSTNAESLEAGGAGSGFVVHPDGWLVTNAHVVGEHVEPRVRLFQRLALTERAAIRAELAEQRELSDSERETIGEILYEKIIDHYLEYADLREEPTEAVAVLNSHRTADGDTEVQEWPATVAAVGDTVVDVDGEPSWGRDVAVLEVDRSNLQTVTLGSAAGLTTGAEIFVIGYPDVGVGELFEAADTALEPTLTTGVVSARRTLNAGIEAIQTDAAINAGNSGGPMYDDEGRVVGVATFGPSDVDIEQIQFGLPVETAREFMAEVGIENVSGELDAAFDAGIEAYWRGDCETATEEMERVLELDADHPTAQRYIARCEAGEAPGQG